MARRSVWKSPVVITAIIVGVAVVIALFSMGWLPNEWLQGRAVQKPASPIERLTPASNQCSGTKPACFAGSPECCSNGKWTCTKAITGASNCSSSTSASQQSSSPRQGTTSQTSEQGPGRCSQLSRYYVSCKNTTDKLGNPLGACKRAGFSEATGFVKGGCGF